MKKFFSVLLSIIFAVALLGTLLLSVVRFNFSYSSITKIFSEMMRPVSAAPVMNDGLFHPGHIRYSLAQYEDFGDFDFSSVDLSSIDLSNMDVNEIVQQYINATGVEVEPETISEILASPEVSEFVDKYVGEIVDYMTGVTDELNINPDDVLNVMNKSLDVYEEKTGEKVDRTGMKEAVVSGVAEAKTQVQASLDAVKEENAETFESLKYVNFVLSLKLFLICVGVCVLLALIIFLINMNVFAMFKYISIPSIVDGVILFLVAIVCTAVVPKIVPPLIADAGLPKGLFEGVWGYLLTILAQMKIYGIVSTLLGVAICVLGFKLDKKTEAVQAA